MSRIADPRAAGRVRRVAVALIGVEQERHPDSGDDGKYDGGNKGFMGPLRKSFQSLWGIAAASAREPGLRFGRSHGRSQVRKPSR